MVWVHWVVYNIPPDTKSLPENVGQARLPQGASLGRNDFERTGYGGPCPPIGRHRYFHKLYALDIRLDLRDATKSQNHDACWSSRSVERMELPSTRQLMTWARRASGKRFMVIPYLMASCSHKRGTSREISYFVPTNRVQKAYENSL